jgi:hypothetical protein
MYPFVDVAGELTWGAGEIAILITASIGVGTRRWSEIFER